MGDTENPKFAIARNVEGALNLPISTYITLLAFVRVHSGGFSSSKIREIPIMENKMEVADGLLLI